MAEEETIEMRAGDHALACTLVGDKQVGTLWEATVKCSDGSTKTARSANRSQAKYLACLECDS